MDTILDYLIDNILGCIAIVISVASPYYAARQTRAAEAQLRRKTPVLEPRKSTMAIDWRASRNPEQPNEIPRLNGIYETELVIRNVEPACSLEVSEIKSIRASAPFPLGFPRGRWIWQQNSPARLANRKARQFSAAQHHIEPLRVTEIRTPSARRYAGSNHTLQPANQTWHPKNMLGMGRRPKVLAGT